VNGFPGIPRRRGKQLDMRSLNRTFLWRKSLADGYRELSFRLLGETIRTLNACPICNGTNLRSFVTIYGFPYLECGSCGHLFSSAQPPEEAMRRMYQEQGEVRSAQNALYMDDALYDRRVAQIAKPKVEHVKSLVPAHGLWLDVGCASGEILSAARDAGWRVRGIEADPGEVKFARRRGFDVIQDFLRGDNADAYVHDAAIVSALNIVEHLVEPSEFMNAISSRLCTGAHVIIEVPRHPSLSSFAAMLYPQTACRHLYAPEHLHVFTEQSMAVLLDKAGLRPINVWIFGQDFQELVSSAALTAGLNESGFFERVCDLTLALQQAIDDADFSDVMFVVATKD
jgi:2-polyprenyl-3-methyl-5-hydroxy-6-metoxy-1,4-benzoquinol methylase